MVGCEYNNHMKKIIISSFISLFTVSAFASAAYFDYAPAPVCPIQVTANLATGSTNPEVYILQGFLKPAGYMNAIPNGVFGAQTKAAVRAFQRDNGISMTGSVGPATRNALNERMCDEDVSVTDGYSYGSYGGIQTGVTYVNPQDPFVQVITPNNSSGIVYTNPGTSYVNNSYNQPVYGSTPAYSTTPSYSQTSSYNNYPVANNIPQVGAINIVYNSYTGYTYGVTPPVGSLTITSPITNQAYREGDTVFVSWSTNNLATTANQYVILLESVNTRQNTVVTVTSSNNASFTLTKQMLDTICSGTCDYNYNQNGQYRVVITTPVTDIAGQTSTFRAAVNVTINRPLTFTGTATISPNKTPVNSGETFRMFVNIPSNVNIYGTQNYTFRLRAICTNGVAVSIAGVQCGNEFTLPYTYSNNQQEIPVTINNTIYYQQDVTFEIITRDPNGIEIGRNSTKVTVNGVPFGY
jgi:peptidoglycan hydrolase-like protein with peptidoglycan-binding domain